MERAVVFVDGNNWYHALKEAGLTGLGWLNYAKVSAKIVGARDWIGTRYYIGQVQQRGNPALYADQRRYMAWTCARDKRVSVHYGRLEERPEQNKLAGELQRYLGHHSVRIDPTVYRDLFALARRYAKSTVVVEKAVDVKIAVDLIQMAIRDEYDVAYLLSADGDYTPATEAVKVVPGKKVFAASLRPGAELARAVYRFIPLKRDWFADCFGE